MSEVSEATEATETGRASLAMRILDAVPAASHEMTALLGLLRIEESREVPTASVSCERQPVLRVNPDFVEEHCRTNEHLFLLVMHELHHVLLGHTRLFPRPTLLHNVAFDAIINALLCDRFPGEEYRSFFVGYYGDRKDALRLLAPPAGEPIEDETLRALHVLLYGPGENGDTGEPDGAGSRGKRPVPGGDTTFTEVFERLTRHLLESGSFTVEIDGLLGNHDAEGEDDWGTAGPLSRELVEAIRAIVEKWPPPAGARKGRSLSDILKTVDVRHATPSERVLAAFRRVLQELPDEASSGSNVRRPVPVPALVPVPVPGDRRAAVSRLSGVEPLLFSGQMVAPGKAGWRACLYLDVSGSMEIYLPYLYGALAPLSALLEPHVQLFSTGVVRVPVSALGRGVATTSGGTDGNAALADALARRKGRVLLVTDGYVGALDRTLVRRLRARRVEVLVLLTPGGWRPDLAPVATRFRELPVLAPERRTA